MAERELFNKSIVNISRNGGPLLAFIDHPRPYLHLKKDDNLCYVLHYFKDETPVPDKAVVLYDNSLFEYRAAGKEGPSYTEYLKGRTWDASTVFMFDVTLDNFDDVNSYVEDLIYQEQIDEVWDNVMFIPHGNTDEEILDVLAKISWNSAADMIGIPYVMTTDPAATVSSRMEIISKMIATEKWNWYKPVHLLGLGYENEIADHAGLIRLCQNILSIDTSYPALLGACGVEIEVSEDNRFLTPKSSKHIIDTDYPEGNDDVVKRNVETFRNAIANLTTGYMNIASSGAPGAGKTTTMIRLEEYVHGSSYMAYPSFHKVEGSDYRIHPDITTYLCMGSVLMMGNIKLDHRHKLMDRCICDVIGFSEYFGNTEQASLARSLRDSLRQHIDAILFFEPLSFTPEGFDDNKRITDTTELQQISDKIRSSVNEWWDPTTKVIYVPSGDYTERLTYILSHL